MLPAEVRAARVRLGLTQYEMAERLGVSIRTYRRWEKTHIKPTGALLVAKIVEEECDEEEAQEG